MLPAFCLTALSPALAQLPTLSPQSALPGDSFVQSTESTYVLGPGDQVEITVFGFEEYTGAKTILSDGTITLPVIGVVPAAGRTPEQLTEQLTTQLQAYLIDPAVTVTLNTLRPVVVNVAGEVQRPGPVSLQGLTDTSRYEESSSGSKPTVSFALIQAGGITQSADIRQVVVRRGLPNGNSITSTVNLWDTLAFGDTSPGLVILQDGDSVYVPRLSDNESFDRRLVDRSSLSPGTVRVRVVGEVKQPGEVQVPPGSSLSSAVAIAGGPTEEAKLAEVDFVRMNEDGEIKRQTIDLRNLTDTYQVRDGDVVIVPELAAASALDWADRLLNPLRFLFGIF
ncbi:polysaccharide biosynthesis/export family protein [Synechococcus sp. PCC 7335]|uniref:polysaccharide biosynthesis/export family protein n=1 Tax=Synechococcus sp. (strain ATCC 29403 / PCC 7335) TaxID=91464 RepID=UPI0008FEC43C|nr:polysaccharide biosynthesis/export family protein [Synechococcus sp. PCC 7335]